MSGNADDPAVWRPHGEAYRLDDPRKSVSSSSDGLNTDDARHFETY